MTWLKDSEVEAFINAHNYDVRVSHNARWIDQKCAADVVCIISDCILNYYAEAAQNATFTSRDIWYSPYAVENVQAVFKKVEVDSETAENEYDKFFQQPMKMLAYAGILSETKNGRENIYSVVAPEVLEYLSLREKNALFFLNKYIEKVLKDSGVWNAFDRFFVNKTKAAYEEVKSAFSSFTVNNTAIGQKTSHNGLNANAGVVECNRIFIKVLNPLAYFRNSLGTERGQLSKHKITYDMLMYNRDNFRDIYAEKPKDVARKVYIAAQKIKINDAFYRYQSTKAKKQLRAYNDIYRNSLSEMAGDAEKATHIHHIFLESEFPEISYYLENLIALTPTQHLNHAHPNGKTTLAVRDFQFRCLLVKADMIADNIANGERVVYSFDGFKVVLTTGLGDESYLEVEENDYDGIKAKLNLEYAS
jgi:hypothetical protein